jgi:hypothetical protein
MYACIEWTIGGIVSGSCSEGWDVMGLVCCNGFAHLLHFRVFRMICGWILAQEKIKKCDLEGNEVCDVRIIAIVEIYPVFAGPLTSVSFFFSICGPSHSSTGCYSWSCCAWKKCVSGFTGELYSGHNDALLRVEEKGGVIIFWRKFILLVWTNFAETFHLDSNSILLVYQGKYSYLFKTSQVTDIKYFKWSFVLNNFLEILSDCIRVNQWLIKFPVNVVTYIRGKDGQLCEEYSEYLFRTKRATKDSVFTSN